MKFVYEYRTSDNVRHEGVVDAANREAAFAALKARGIRPSAVRDAPGFFNKLFGKGKRWLAISVLGVGCLVLGFAVFLSPDAAVPDGSSPQPRHQIYGDPGIMSAFEREHFRNLMPTEGDAVLAHFAQPGVIVDLEGDSQRSAKALDQLVKAGFAPALELTDADRGVREAAELKRIVMSMRAEFKRYLSDGVGTPATFLKRLVERQRREAAIYANALSDLRAEKKAERFERINASLRAVGLRTVPMPEK